MSVQNDPPQPSTADILAEVERRRSETSHQKSEGTRRIIIFLDRCVFWLSKHWLAVVNTLAFLYVGLPILSAVLLYFGIEGPGGIIQSLYGPPICHQLPQRSWFLFGPKIAYSLPELMDYFDIEPHLSQIDDVQAVYIAAKFGGPDLGYKVALCQRDVAIYGTIMLAGLAYALLRRWVKIHPLPVWIYVAFGIIPIGMDGGYQWITYILDYTLPNLLSIDSPLPVHETTPALRVLTGTLFGLMTVWLMYPHAQAMMEDFQSTLRKRFGWE
ncbi:MAG: DUF2085 domain-containing protein [Anaerolineae bacterium]|jgi:uncharacterized membrane protein